ncbi:radical SAM protein [Flavobacterium sp. J27]|uniref:radical SAM protein n=1 Tax=Flavobacterium sp. J27 TaxID=2060419 RepID=UPI001032366A|nr:radical SAM protein [Flavobacterium sp. J27]
MYTNSLVVKVASRCNLNCTYCYVYNMGDESYKKQPKFMSEDVIQSLFLRIKNHCEKNKLERFLIVFHGGEPLLTGISFYEKFIEIENKIINNSVKIDYSMQSNGVLLDRETAKKLKELNIQVGISLDTTILSNNQNRIFHNGKGAYKEIISGFDVLKEIYGSDYANCLSVIDTNQDVKEVYNHYKEIGVKNVHLLFQDFNYIGFNQNTVPKTGEWLIGIFDIWYNDKDENKPNIRPLTDLIGLIFGFQKYSEIFGKGVNDTLVVETDGSIETVDTLKICGDGFTLDNLNVLHNEFDELYESSELARKYYYGHENLCKSCQNCIIEPVCGGGFIGHRFSDQNGFNNPSIYCKEIVKLVCHLQNRILKDLPDDFIKNTNIEELSYEEVIESIEGHCEVE